MSIRVNPGVRLLVGMALALLLGAPLSGWVQAAGLPPRPPVPTVEPSPQPEKSKPETKRLIGAWIELRASSAPADAWTEVQWQDTAGDWHPVEGWRGYLDDGKKVWWVAQVDFGTGPFRWVIAQAEGSEPLAVSEPFSLPQDEGETTIVEVSIAP